MGRNPYVRVLSGFLDKMVNDPLRHDQWTYKSTNRNMGLDGETRWDNSIESFRKFVRVLAVKGVEEQVRAPHGSRLHRGRYGAATGTDKLYVLVSMSHDDSLQCDVDTCS